jgi:hypothetical protein
MWLSENSSASGIAVCRVAQLGFCRILTNRVIMGEGALSMKSAWGIAMRLQSDPRFTFLAEPSGLNHWIEELSVPRTTSGAAWTDLYLAAFAKAAKLRLVSFDKGFRKFPGLDFQLLP